MKASLHEQFDRASAVRGSSDRSFGLVFALFFAVAGLWPLRSGRSVRGWALAIAGMMLAAAFLRPAVLHPLNRLWTWLGLLLARVVNPVVMAVMFAVVFVPAGLVLRLLGKDPLRLRPDPATASYWLVRQPPGPDPDTMAKQF